MQAVRVRVIFTLPQRFHYPYPLVYVEYFNPFRAQRSADLGLLVTTRSVRAGRIRTGIIRLDSIIRSCHLFPQFPLPMPRFWTATSSLDHCASVYLNEFLDDEMYAMP